MPIMEETTAAKPEVSVKRAPHVPEIRSQDLGLTILHEPADFDETKADIVAIHGIGANPANTWVHRKSGNNWLQHQSMLPSQLPETRIMAFGYDSNWFGDNAVRTSIDSVAGKLLKELEVNRVNCAHRPIVFIAHCFGGLVIQKAFTMAASNPTDYPHIFACTRGMVFLGTPHHGITDGASATQEQLYRAILAANMQIQDNAMRSMIQTDDHLTGVVHEFTRMVNNMGENKPTLYCFYETRASKIGKIAAIDTRPEFVINEAAGTLGGHEKESLALDHFSMNKFENEHDNHYKNVMRVVVKMVVRAESLENGAFEQEVKPSARRPSRIHIPTFAAPIDKEQNFAPRKDILKRIHKAFRSNEKVALCGDKGFGKTHIAVEYAHYYREKHPAATMFWVNASSAAQFELSYKLIDEALGSSHEHPTHSSLLEYVHRQMKRVSRMDLLVILDEFEDETSLTATHDLNKSLLDLLPTGGQTKILATTRSRSHATRWVGGRSDSVIGVHALSKDDVSTLLFGKQVKEESKLQWVNAVSDALGSSAGELSMLLHYKTRLGKEFSRKAYAESIGASLKGDKILNPINSQSKIARSWTPLHELIKSQHADLIHLMNLICLMDVQCVPNSIFTKPQLDKAIPLLTEYGVVEPTVHKRVFSVTALVRQCVKESLQQSGATDPQREAEEMALNLICDRFNNDLGAELLPCALAILQNVKPTSPTGLRSMATLHSKVSKYFEDMKNFFSAILHLEKAQDIQKGYFESEKKHLELADTTSSIKRLKDSTKLNEMSFAPSNMQEQRPLISNTAYARSMDDTQARNIHDLTPLHLRQTEPGYGDYYDTAHFSKPVSGWSKPNHGTKVIQDALRQSNMASANVALAEYQEAEKQYMSALKNMEAQMNIIGDNAEIRKFHHKIHFDLAYMYCEQQRLDEAGTALQSLMSGQQILLGDNHPDTLLTRHNLASLRQEYGDYVEAEEELRNVLMAQAHLLGPDDPATFRTLCSIALNNRLQGRLEESERQFKSILKSQQKRLGNNHQDCLKTKRMLEEVSEELNLVD